MKRFSAFSAIILLFFSVFYSCEEDKVTVTGVSLNSGTLTLKKGESAQLQATINPADAENKNVTWSSSDSIVATVSNGSVTAVNTGTATITVETEDGGFKATCSVKVEADVINVTGITISESVLNINVDETSQLTATIEPSDATDQSVSWTSSDNTIATVSETGLVDGKSAGTATITVKTTDGAKIATCEVTVISVGTLLEIMEKGFLRNSNGGSVDITCNANGIPYIAHQTSEASLSGSKAYVQVHNYSGSGTAWSKYSGQNVGICPSEYTTPSAPSIAISNDGTVFVAYQYYDDINDNRYGYHIVSAYDDTNWVTLGGDGSASNNCFIMNGNTKLEGPTQMAFKQDGTLMLAMVNYGDGYVNYFDNDGNWSSFTGDWKSYSGYKLDNSDFWAGNVNLEVHVNKPYTYIRSSSGTPRCGVLGGSETNGENVQWEWLGNVLVGSDIGGHNRDFETPLTISSTGEIYTAYQKAVGIERNVYVKHFDKTNDKWVNIFTKDFEYYNNEAEVVISNDILYLVVARYDDGIEIYKYNNDNNTWSFEGKTPHFGATYYTIDLASGINGEFYIAFTVTDAGADSDIGVYKFTPAQ